MTSYRKDKSTFDKALNEIQATLQSLHESLLQIAMRSRDSATMDFAFSAHALAQKRVIEHRRDLVAPSVAKQPQPPTFGQSLSNEFHEQLQRADKKMKKFQPLPAYLSNDETPHERYDHAHTPGLPTPWKN